MRINIVIDVDVRESGFSSEDEIKDNIVDFTRDLLNNGAENQGIGYTLCEVDYNNCYQVVNDKVINKHSSFNPKKYIKEMLLNEETFDVAILTVENSIDEIRLINENSQNSFDNQFDKLILKYLLKYVQVNKTKFNCVHDLYDILNNQNFQEYVMERINDKWTCIHQRIISLTILFQELTGIIYKASSEN